MKGKSMIMLLINLMRNLPSWARTPVRFVVNMTRLLLWWFFGKSIPPPYAYKIFLLMFFSIKYKTKIFVETGTYMGDTIDSLKNTFRKLYSIEMDDTLYLRAKKYFKGEKNIKIIRGDSGKVLPELLKKINEPTLFWLDAHYCGEGTARGSQDTPIMKELRSVLLYKNLNHIVLIDDARVFNGKNSYPELDWLKSFIENKWKRRIVEVKYDVVRIYPKK